MDEERTTTDKPEIVEPDRVRTTLVFAGCYFFLAAIMTAACFDLVEIRDVVGGLASLGLVVVTGIAVFIRDKSEPPAWLRWFTIGEALYDIGILISQTGMHWIHRDDLIQTAPLGGLAFSIAVILVLRRFQLWWQSR